MSQDDQSAGRKGRAVTPEHKAAMIQGRSETRIVRNYLEALDGARQSGGRRRSKEALQKRLAAVEQRLESANLVERLDLTQKRIDLQKALEIAGQSADIDELESAFVNIAASYSERNGISFQAWREVGVSQKVLEEAGIR